MGVLQLLCTVMADCTNDNLVVFVAYATKLNVYCTCQQYKELYSYRTY